MRRCLRGRSNDDVTNILYIIYLDGLTSHSISLEKTAFYGNDSLVNLTLNHDQKKEEVII